MFVKYEKSLLSVSYSPEFDVNGITDPFLEARILEVMAYTAKGSKVLSDELGDLNESIYRLERCGELVILILYTYSETQKLLLESQKIRIHLLREAEKQICGEGYGGLQLESISEIVPLLRNLFINNIY